MVILNFVCSVNTGPNACVPTFSGAAAKSAADAAELERALTESRAREERLSQVKGLRRPYSVYIRNPQISYLA